MGWIQNNEHVHQLQAGHKKIKAHLDNVFIIFPQIFQQTCAEFQSWFQTVCDFNNFFYKFSMEPYHLFQWQGFQI